jgi:hypothetical protein
MEIVRGKEVLKVLNEFAAFLNPHLPEFKLFIAQPLV